MVKRFTEEVQLRPVDTSTGAAQAQLSFVSQLEQFQQDARNVQAVFGTRAGVEEAQGVELKRDESGRLIQPEARDVGLGDVLLTGGFQTRAFNKTLRDGFLAGLENDIRFDVSRLELENPDSLTSFNTAVDGYRKGILNGVEPGLRGPVQQFMDRQINSSRIDVQRKTLANAEAEAKGNTLAAIDSGSQEAFRDAREGKRAASANAIQNVFANIETLDIPANKKQELKREVEREATEQGFLFQLEAVADSAGVEAAFKQLDKSSKTLPKGFTPDEADALITRGQTMLSRKKARQDAATSTSLKQAREEIADLEKAIAQGIPIDSQETLRLGRLVNLDPTGDLKKRFGIATETAAFSVQSRAVREQVLTDLQTGSVKLEDVDRIASLLKSNADVNKAYQDNGYAMGVKQGLIEEIPFEIDNPESFSARTEQAQILTQHTGIPVSALDDQSAQLVADALPKMTVNEKILLATTLSSDPEAWGQVDKKNAHAFAMAGATNDQAVMTGVFTGQEMITQKLASLPRKKDYLTIWDDETEGVYGTEDAGSLLEAALNHYVATSGDIQGSGDSFDDAAFKNSIQAVSGGIEEINGLKLELPRGVSQDAFETFIQEIEPETVEAFGGVMNMDNQNAADLIKTAQLKNEKNGVYSVRLDNGGLMSASNPALPFFIEWDQDIVNRNAALRASRAQTRRREAVGGAEALIRRRELDIKAQEAREALLDKRSKAIQERFNTDPTFLRDITGP